MLDTFCCFRLVRLVLLEWVVGSRRLSLLRAFLFLCGFLLCLQNYRWVLLANVGQRLTFSVANHVSRFLLILLNFFPQVISFSIILVFLAWLIHCFLFLLLCFETFYFVKLLPTFILFYNHNVLIQTVDEGRPHLFILLRREFVVHIILSEMAVKTCLQGEAVRDVKLFVKHDACCSFFRFFILIAAAVKSKHFCLFA